MSHPRPSPDAVRRPIFGRRAVAVCLAAVLTCSLSGGPAGGFGPKRGFAQVRQVGAIAAEANVKTAYIYGFSRYITWPKDRPRTEFVIGLLGDTELVGPLSKLAKKKQIKDRSTGRTLPIRLELYAGPSDVGNPQILIIPPSVSNEAAATAVARLQSQPVLVVGDSEIVSNVGGAIRFVVVDGRVKFVVHISNANDRGLKVDAKLLKAAHEVIQRS